jgi:hypothetical protein
MECDLNLLSYGFFKIPKIIIIFKALLIILNLLFKKNLCDIFYMSYNIMIEIENGKQC